MNLTQMTIISTTAGKNTGVGCHFLLQEIFPTQGLNPGLPHCRQMLYHLSHQGSYQAFPITVVPLIISRSNISSVQFSSVAQSCPTLCNPMNCSTPGLSVHHQFLEFTQTLVHQVGHAIQPSHPLSSPSPPAPSPSQHQRWPKYWSFSFSISPSKKQYIHAHTSRNF